MLRTTMLLIACIGLLLTCSTSKKVTSDTQVQLDELQRLMTGTFDSSAQAKADSSYFDISLQMYPIWKDRGHFLYVEQAVSAMQKKPYRQRIYQLVSEKKGTIRSVVYTLPNPESYIGAWKNPTKFDQLTMDDLSIREGCAVILSKQEGGSYTGSTDGDACGSTLRGASYATSKVSIKKGLIVSWDQGFNEAGEQVWGATKGGYEFKGLPKE